MMTIPFTVPGNLMTYIAILKQKGLACSCFLFLPFQAHSTKRERERERGRLLGNETAVLAEEGQVQNFIHLVAKQPTVVT